MNNFVQAQYRLYYSGDQKKVAALMVEMLEYSYSYSNDKEMDCVVDCAPTEQQCPYRCVTKHTLEFCRVESSACYFCLDDCTDGTVSELLVEFSNSLGNPSAEQEKCGLNCLPTKLQCPARCVDEHISEGENSEKCMSPEESSGCFKCVLDECVNGAGTVGVTSFTILFSLALAAFRM